MEYRRLLFAVSLEESGSRNVSSSGARGARISDTKPWETSLCRGALGCQGAPINEESLEDYYSTSRNTYLQALQRRPSA